jgi:hypothetical protein
MQRHPSPCCRHPPGPTHHLTGPVQPSRGCQLPPPLLTPPDVATDNPPNDTAVNDTPSNKPAVTVAVLVLHAPYLFDPTTCAQFVTGKDDFSSNSPSLLGNQGPANLFSPIIQAIQDLTQNLAPMVDPQRIPGMVQAQPQSPGTVVAHLTDLNHIPNSQATLLLCLFD